MYYKYSVLSERGSEINGVEQGSFRELDKRFRENRYYVISLEPDIFKSLQYFLRKKKVKASALADFFEDFKNSLETGLGINEVVLSLEESSTDSMLSKALSKVYDDLTRGFSLTEAFSNTGIFPKIALSMLKTGEKSGNLEEVFYHLAEYYSREAEFLQGLRNACLYPAVVLSMLTGIMFYISFKVIPNLKGLIPEGNNSYFATKLLLFLAGFLKDYWMAILILPIIIIFILSRVRREKTDKLDSFYYLIPLIGELVKDIALTMFFSNLALLQKNGINTIESLSLISENSAFKFLSGKILKLKTHILSGQNFWQAFAKDEFFPSMVYKSVKKGEEIGRLEVYLYKLSRYYSARVTKRIQTILALLQPALLIICAVFLMLIISAFIIPVYSNLSNIAGGKVNF